MAISDPDDLAARLREAREALGLSFTTAAIEARIAVNTYKAAESAKMNRRNHTRSKLEAWLRRAERRLGRREGKP